jgi:glucose/arabinose dehydrogenase
MAEKLLKFALAVWLFTASATWLPAQSNPPVPPPGDFGEGVRVEIVASRLQAPWSLVFVPDGRLFVTERPGQVRVVAQNKLFEKPALVLSDVTPNVKMGLLGMVAHPGFATNHLFYLAYNYTTNNSPKLRVVRYRETQNTLIEPRILIENIPAFQNHTGCRLRFGPDGKLFMTTGDANDPPLAQRLDSLAGKILRLNDDGSTPVDNPFANTTNARPEIWSYGHRNPQGLDFQPGTGFLFAPEHGPDHGDEINHVVKGNNYGWPVIHHRLSKAGMGSPLLEFTPAVAPSGASFYRGNVFSALKGNLLVGCLRGEGILRVQLDGTNVVSCARMLHRKYGRIRDVVEGPDGFVYFTTSQFDPPEGTPRPDYDMVLRVVPKRIPETGAAIAAEWRDSEPTPATFDPNSTDANVLIPGYCAPCHGPGLRGGLQRTLLDGRRVFAKDDDGLRRVIHGGLAEKGMPGFGAALKPAQVDALIKFIKQHEATGATTVTNAPAPGPNKPS